MASSKASILASAAALSSPVVLRRCSDRNLPGINAAFTGGAAVFFMYEYPLKFGGLAGPVKLLALMRPPLRKLEGHFSGLEGWAVARGSTTSARREARLRYGLGRQYEGDTCAQLGLQRMRRGDAGTPGVERRSASISL